ncbi:MAG: YfiR family protein [Sideroxyarcus sp.]|nr:YfiR family protein [Sideroxyarcus sp.]
MAARAAQTNANPQQVEAAFLRNFARYVTWPDHAFADEHSSWNVCILGNDQFDGVLEKTLYGRTEQGRSFKIFHAAELERLPSCHIVFVGFKDSAKRRAALAGLKMQPVLTVGDAPEFLREGGIIRFRVGEHVEMSINLDQARSASLAIPTKMLEVSHEVVENGMPRRWR